MPMITYRCSKCGFQKDRLVKPSALKSLLDSEPCPNEDCYGNFERVLGSPKSVSKIIIDNNQPKAVEVMPDIEELMEERAKKGEDRGFGQPAYEED